MSQSGGGIYEFALRKFEKNKCANVSRITYCAESPAGATLFLVFDISDVSLVPPVNGHRQINGFSKAEEGRTSVSYGGVEDAQAAPRDQVFILLILLQEKRQYFFKTLEKKKATLDG